MLYRLVSLSTMACCPTEEKYGYDDSRFEKDVDAHFHCSICYNVLKEPMMCRNNEHIFCRECITEHLNVNSHTCPECNEDLTVDTLRRARLATNYLSELKIKCDYSDRGCQEYIRLAELKCHVGNCGFAPVKCSNEECEMMVNKRELIHHESSVCEYRKVKCHSCKKLEQDMKEIKMMLVKMCQKLDSLENTVQISSAINHASNPPKKDILVAGGLNKSTKRLMSVERFSWKNNSWERLSSLNIARKGATSFVYENQVFVAGGYHGEVIEVLKLNKGLQQRQWGKFMVTIPYPCELRSVVYLNPVVLFCTNKNNYCGEICLTPPYKYKQLCEMPEPERDDYTVVAFDHKVLIFGGSRVDDDSALDSVLEYDINTNAFKVMRPLPCAASNMAGVRWGDQAVLIGGFHEDGPSDKVFMYDSTTSTTTQLPSMLEERSSCAAVITGNTIVVMGGVGKRHRLRSVEAFTLGGYYTWRYLPAMNDVRSVSTATILPTENDS